KRDAAGRKYTARGEPDSEVCGVTPRVSFASHPTAASECPADGSANSLALHRKVTTPRGSRRSSGSTGLVRDGLDHGFETDDVPVGDDDGLVEELVLDVANDTNDGDRASDEDEFRPGDDERAPVRQLHAERNERLAPEHFTDGFGAHAHLLLWSG